MAPVPCHGERRAALAGLGHRTHRSRRRRHRLDLRGEQERDHLEILLAPWLIARIEHIGSTAIPDLPAKPIIDFQAPVTDLGGAHLITAALAPHDWHYVDTEVDQRPWRRFLVKVTDGRRTAHLHLRVFRASRRAGIDADRAWGALVHGLRHTFATEFANSAVSVYTLVNLLGHESMVTSQRYVTAAGTETRSAAAQNKL
jgi:GrpB-like predicted nucleotidyltransferase (UPF0157 family)